MKEQVTMPSNNLVPKGRASIELFDLGGDLVQKEVQDNYVNQAVLQDISDLMTLNSLGVTLQSAPLLQLNSGLILTDFDGEVTPQNRHSIKGNEIGFAFVYGVYSTEKVGGYNATESVISGNYVKLVFDFPTSSANGTFNSVYTGPYIYSFSNNARLVPSRFAYSGDHPTTYVVRRMFRSGGKLMYLNGTSFQVFESLPLTGKINSIATSGEGTLNQLFENAPKTSHTLSTSYTQVAFNVASQKYYFTKRSSDLNIYSSPVSDPTNIRVEKDMTAQLRTVSSNVGIQAMAVDNLGKYLYVQLDSFGVYKIDIATWTLLEQAFKPAAGSFNQSMSFDITDPDIVYIGGGLSEYAYDLGGKKFLYTSRVSWSAIDNVGTVKLSSQMTLGGFVPNPSSTNNEISVAPRMFSRALLEQPVTKTSQNTMKITYEFMLPEYDLLKR